MLRRRLLCVLSLLLCGITVVLWVRSYWHDDLLLFVDDPHYEAGGKASSTRLGIGFDHGTLYGVHRWMPPLLFTDMAFYSEDHGIHLLRDESEVRSPPENTVRFAGFLAGRQRPFPHQGLLQGRTLVGVPGWFAALLLIVPAWYGFSRVVPRRKNAPGLCPSCGYDLRATPGRCSECGWREAEENAK
jgi:hypothetical protein